MSKLPHTGRVCSAGPVNTSRRRHMSHATTATINGPCALSSRNQKYFHISMYVGTYIITSPSTTGIHLSKEDAPRGSDLDAANTEDMVFSAPNHLLMTDPIT